MKVLHTQGSRDKLDRTVIKKIPSIYRRSLREIWEDLWTMLVVNSLWIIANLLVIPGPPATIALQAYANRIVHNEVTDLSDLWVAFKRSWGVGWRWGAVNLAVVGLLAINYYLVSNALDVNLGSYLQGLYIAVGLAWFLLQFFALPFLFEQEQMKVSQALRNSALMIGRNLGFSFLFGLSLVVFLSLAALTFALGIMFGAVFLALAGNFAVNDQLAPIRAGRNIPPTHNL